MNSLGKNDYDGFDYGKRHIRPTISGSIGTAFPKKRLPEPMCEPERTDTSLISTEGLKKIITANADWRAVLDAADELGRRVKRLDDVEALGDVARFCQDEGNRKAAMDKLAPRIPGIADPRILEAIVMNTDDDRARRDAIEALGRRTDDITSTFTLVHIALCAKQKFARLAAVNKLRGKDDALNVVSLHSEFEDTREFAKNVISGKA